MRTRPHRLSATVVADPPVVLAPMAGITNTAFRRLCREQINGVLTASAASGPGAAPAVPELAPERVGGLFVSEMITTRALVERNPKTLQLIRFEPDESPRSVQLYGIDPAVVGAAVHMIVAENLADHVDLNFGCPVPKVTRKGGGSALPWHLDLFDDIVAAAVKQAAGVIPVTIKMRIGIDSEHHTYREAALRAQDAGVAHVALHGRTAADFYGGTADWGPISELVELLDIPVLGNGDIWEADDALRMVRETGCAGVVVGRGCLGRPWLFADLAHAFTGSAARELPGLDTVARTMRRHAQLLGEWMGDEARGVTDFRKHVAWYLKGFSVGGDLRRALACAASLAELDDLLDELDRDQPFPTAVLGHPRGRTSGGRKVSLPQGWLTDRSSRRVPAGAELDVSGG